MAAVLWDLPVRPARDLHDRPDLHRAVLHVRDLRRVLSRLVQVRAIEDVEASQDLPRLREWPVGRQDLTLADADRDRGRQVTPERQDRKSTRLNSSHDQISYAVFCLKKKNKKHHENYE